MATMLEELDAILTTPSEALVPGGLPPLPNQAPSSMTEELDAILGPQAPAPSSDRNPSGPDHPSRSTPWDGAAWLKANPQAALDFILQGVGTGGGIALGAMTGPAAPIAAPAGGAAGNVAGKQISRRIGQAFPSVFTDAQEPPDLDSMETAIDAGLGALGPVANTVMRVGNRAVTGLRQGPFNQKMAQSRKALDDELAEEMKLPGGVVNMEERRRGLHGLAADWEVQNAITRSGTVRATMERGVGGGLVGSLSFVEPVTGALIGAGLSEAVLSRAVPALLANPKYGHQFARWALGVNKHTKTEVAASLAGIFAEANLSPRERSAFNSIHGDLTGGGNEAASFDDSVGRYRNPSSGRFSRADEILRESARDADDGDDDQ